MFIVLFLFFFFLSFFLSFCVDLLPSDTVGRFCSVWNMILKSFTHLNFRVTEEEKKRQKKMNILSILNVLTLVKMEQKCSFLKKKKNHKQCIYDRFHINF